MRESGHVLVGVDFSPSSRRALEVAAAVSARAGCQLDVVHALNVNHLAGSGSTLPALKSWIAEQRDLLSGRLEEWAEDTKADGLVVNCRVSDGAASRVIPELAASSRAKLVVVGRRGAANLSHVLLGSVSERVSHLAPCPVLVVPQGSSPAGANPRPLAPRRLLVGVDFSPASRSAFDAATRIANWLEVDQDLLVVHVANDTDEPPDAAALERWAGSAAAGGVPIRSSIQSGRPETVLVEVAKRESCDWLVVGAHGQTALAAMLMGSTTDRVLKLSDRPVLVIPPSESALGEVSS